MVSNTGYWQQSATLSLNKGVIHIALLNPPLSEMFTKCRNALKLT